MLAGQAWPLRLGLGLHPEEVVEKVEEVEVKMNSV